MGRRRGRMRELLLQRQKQLRRIYARKLLTPPFLCPICNNQTLYVKKDKSEAPLIKYVFYCSKCGFKSDPIVLRDPPFKTIDAYHKVIDAIYSSRI